MTTFIPGSFGSPTWVVRQENEEKTFKLEWKKKQLSLFTDDLLGIETLKTP